jgi:type II secretory pathway pseudopilin PulG
VSLPRTGNEVGASLVEVLIAVMIVSIAFAAILGGFFTAVVGSSVHRRGATGEADLRRASEFVKAKPYAACPDSSDYGDGLSLSESTASVTVLFWDGEGLTDSDFASACPDGGDEGLQKVTITIVPSGSVSGPEEITEQIDVIKRGP